MVHFPRLSRHQQGVLVLVLVTLLWGSTFVVVKGAIAQVHPAWLSLIRFVISAVCCLPWLKWQPLSLRIGLELGFWLILGYGSQSIGLESTSASRSAFITSLNAVILPLLLGLLGHPVQRQLWWAVGLAVAGVGLLSNDGSPPNLGDLWTLGTAASYAVYIWRLEHYSHQLSSLALAAAQIWGTMGFALIWALATPQSFPGWQGLDWGPLIYLSVLATALTVWLQSWGQRRVRAVEASILFTLEPLWAALFAFWLLGERFGVQGWLGAGLIVAAMLFTQLYPTSAHSPAKSPVLDTADS
jgi:drug/metabolite transporter (DMT)-like permease